MSYHVDGALLSSNSLSDNPSHLVVDMEVGQQVFYKANEDISYMDYEADECDSGLHAFFHDMTQVELRDNWARCW